MRAPKARAHAERWVETLRREYLDRLLIVGRRHIHHVLGEYVTHYNEHRPHRALRQRPPLRAASLTGEQADEVINNLDRVGRRTVLGGLIHESHPAA